MVIRNFVICGMLLGDNIFHRWRWYRSEITKQLKIYLRCNDTAEKLFTDVNDTANKNCGIITILSVHLEIIVWEKFFLELYTVIASKQNMKKHPGIKFFCWCCWTLQMILYIRNCLYRIFRGLEETVSWKNLKLKISCQTPFFFFLTYWNQRD